MVQLQSFQSVVRSLSTLMFINITSLTQWNANQCYSVRMTYLVFESFQILFATPSLFFTAAKLQGNRSGAMARALASHQCGPSSIPGPSVIKMGQGPMGSWWVEFVVGSRPCSEDFTPGSPVFLPVRNVMIPVSTRYVPVLFSGIMGL